ncbi:MAG: hypothetical protein EXR58_03550 [Chloroflexi bacterium]|nr:hypothetical protein [Chloroflexota bacterium]
MVAGLVVVGAAIFWYRRRQTARPIRKEITELTLASLAAGDVVNLNGHLLIVEAAVDCREALLNRETRWRWLFLGDGSLLESSPSENILYAGIQLVRQGSEDFQELVADGGVLKRFEEQVRSLGAGAELDYQSPSGGAYRMRSTGTFAVDAMGTLPAREVWRDISASQPDNVYFKLAGAEDSSLLGVWTTHIALCAGRPLSGGEILGLYPGQDGLDAAGHHRLGGLIEQDGQGMRR